MLNDVIDVLEIHLRDAVNFNRLGQKEKAGKELDIVKISLMAMSAMIEASFYLTSDNCKYEIVLKAKDGLSIVLARVYKH